MDMNPEHHRQPESEIFPDAGPVGPSWESIVEGAVAASIALPFMQAFASKAGEDAYQALKSLIKRFKPSREPVRLYDSSTNTRLVFVSPLPDDAIKQLAAITPACLRGKVATWDADAGAWQISAYVPPRYTDIVMPEDDSLWHPWHRGRS